MNLLLITLWLKSFSALRLALGIAPLWRKSRGRLSPPLRLMAGCPQVAAPITHWQKLHSCFQYSWQIHMMHSIPDHVWQDVGEKDHFA